ncbi:TetR/AcrR family transcriptional regulator [Pseudomonas sp. NPDC087358]|uniref:TetR/AcrR family transcriptional regulator n=1 Tax=Pseudomonas sp. NPDC087358 TaxID=3364439 RepID=UPI0038512B5C
MSPRSDNSPGVQRPPQQARGRERVTAILDACARLIVVQTVSKLSVHTIAKEAGTSIGSMYHFFADKQAVLDALGDRHLEAIGEVTEQIMAISPAQWVDYQSAEVVEHLFMPIIRYIEAHADFMLMISPGFSAPLRAPQLQADIEANYARVLAIRTPALAGAQLRRVVRTLFGLPLGLVQITLSNGEFKRELLLEEAPLALTAYLDRIEQQYAGQGL